ncbi:MAG: VanZ family protein [Bacilli bacterium]|nr:VanZ family protein [Bacilli bacterium]
MKVSKKYLIFTIIAVVFALAINGYIIMHSCLHATASGKESNSVAHVVEGVVETFSGDSNTINDSNFAAFAAFVRKAFGHFGLFMVSGLLTSMAFFLVLNPHKWAKYYLQIIIALAFGLTIAVITEVIQLNVPGRSGEFTDVLIDYGGYVFGFSIIFLILFLVIKSKNKKAPSRND